MLVAEASIRDPEGKLMRVVLANGSAYDVEIASMQIVEQQKFRMKVNAQINGRPYMTIWDLTTERKIELIDS